MKRAENTREFGEFIIGKYLNTFPDLNLIYLENYVKLIIKNIDNPKSFYTESHHILTRAKFPEYIKEEWNCVNLSFADHVISHWLLWKSIGWHMYMAALFVSVGYSKNRPKQSILNQSKMIEEIKKACKDRYKDSRVMHKDGVNRNIIASDVDNMILAGFEFGFTPGTYDNRKNTLIEKYGVISTIKVPGALEKSRKTCFEKYRHSSQMQNQEIINLRRNNWISKYGVKNVFCLDSVKEKIKHTSREKYGDDCPQKSDIVKKRISDGLLAKPNIECPWCDTIGSPSNMKRWHFDMCTKNPNAISRVKNKPRSKTQCPYCKIVGDVGSLKLFHFENCKYSPNYVDSRAHETCPHCNFTGFKNMKRYHFDNCKLIKDLQ